MEIFLYDDYVNLPLGAIPRSSVTQFNINLMSNWIRPEDDTEMKDSYLWPCLIGLSECDFTHLCVHISLKVNPILKTWEAAKCTHINITSNREDNIFVKEGKIMVTPLWNFSEGLTPIELLDGNKNGWMLDESKDWKEFFTQEMNKSKEKCLEQITQLQTNIQDLEIKYALFS